MSTGPNAEVILPELYECLPGEGYTELLGRLATAIDEVEYKEALNLLNELARKVGDAL